MVLRETVLETDDLLVEVFVKLIDRRVPHYFIRGRIVLFLNHLRVPLDGDVALLEEVLHLDAFARLDDAAAAFLNPVAL